MLLNSYSRLLPRYGRSKTSVLLRGFFLCSRILQKNHRFFVPNQEDSQNLLQDILQRVQTRKTFLLPPVNTFQAPGDPQKVLDFVQEYTFDPSQSWEQILHNNIHLPPCIGSIIEFHNHEIDAKQIGIVVKPSLSKFNENHNKHVVLTVHNELTRVYPQDITFHNYRVFDPDCDIFPTVLYHRFNEQCQERLVLVDVLREFVSVTASHSDLVCENLRILYPQLSLYEKANATSLLTIVKHLSPPEKWALLPSYFQQASALHSIHNEMAKDPSRWLVSSCIPNKNTNIGAWGCSNEIAYPTAYLANSRLNYESIREFLLYTPSKLNLLVQFLQELENDEYDDLVIKFNIGSGRPFRAALKTLLFALVYPHPQLLGRLSKITGEKSISEFLKSQSILNNRKNPLTDAVLSALLVGTQGSQLAVSSVDELDLSKTQELSNPEVDTNTIDRFPHLRSDKTYYQDNTIYILPSSEKLPNLGVSLEKLNSRKYLINIHLPDLATRICPNSDLYVALNTFASAFQQGGPFFGEFKHVFHQSFVDQLKLKENQFVEAADLQSNETPRTCMTVSFEYHTYASKPLDSLESARITFDSLDGVETKSVTAEELENVLSGKLDPSILSPFRLFNRRQHNEAKRHFSADDIHNLGFIYNVMRSHLKLRNLRGASTANPCLERKLERSLSYSTEMEGEILTEISMADSSAFPRVLLMVNELKSFCSSLVSSFCGKNHIPVIRSNQKLLDSDDSNDEVYISHENNMLPNYFGNEYYQTLYAKDSTGYISAAAKLIGNNFLGLKQYSADSQEYDVPRGLKHGGAEVTNVFGCFESYFNQLQILAHLHQQHVHNGPYLQLVLRNAPFKVLGFPVNGPLPAKFLAAQAKRLGETEAMRLFINTLNWRFWVLTSLQHSTEPASFTCYITRFGLEANEEYRVATAWCVELCLEVDILVDTGTDLSIGGSVTACQILHLDPATGQCLLRKQETL